jgi:hypothetical protein
LDPSSQLQVFHSSPSLATILANVRVSPLIAVASLPSTTLPSPQIAGIERPPHAAPSPSLALHSYVVPSLQVHVCHPFGPPVTSASKESAKRLATRLNAIVSPALLDGPESGVTVRSTVAQMAGMERPQHWAPSPLLDLHW